MMEKGETTGMLKSIKFLNGESKNARYRARISGPCLLSLTALFTAAHIEIKSEVVIKYQINDALYFKKKGKYH